MSAAPAPSPSLHRRPIDRQSLVAGLVVALLINGGGLGTIFYLHRYAGLSTKNQNEISVDVKLLKSGKKRDMSFLPHVEAAPRVPEQNKIKVTDNPDRPKDRPKEPPKPDLKKAFDEIKNLRTDDD